MSSFKIIRFDETRYQWDGETKWLSRIEKDGLEHLVRISEPDRVEVIAAKLHVESRSI